MIESKISYEYKQSYFVNEDEIRLELINTILEKVKTVQMWNCRHTPCPDPYYYKGFPFVPPTGDILVKENEKLHTYELKYPTMRALKDQRTGTLYYRILGSAELLVRQKEFLERGLLTLIVIGEMVQDVSQWEISEGRKPLSEIEEDIAKLRDLFGQDKIPYTFVIITKENYHRYESYINSIKPQAIKKKGEVFTYKFPLRLEKIVSELTPVEEVGFAVRSRLCIEIIKRLFGI